MTMKIHSLSYISLQYLKKGVFATACTCLCLFVGTGLAFGQSSKDVSKSAVAILSIEQSPSGDILYLGPQQTDRSTLHSQKMSRLLTGKQKHSTNLRINATSKKVAKKEVVPSPVQKTVLKESSESKKPKGKVVKFQPEEQSADILTLELETDDDQEITLKAETQEKTPAKLKRPYVIFPTKDNAGRIPAQLTSGKIPGQAQPNPIESNQWKLKKISEIQLTNDNSGTKPEDMFKKEFKEASTPEFWPRNQVGTTVYWDSPNICYHRLLTEDPILERYGQGPCNPVIQVGRSAAHWGVSAFRAPAVILFDRDRVRSPLGYQRPGSPVPSVKQQIWPAR